MRCADLTVMFAVAAGPRRGFGHLLRARALARAMDVRPLVAVRGGRSVREIALALGCDVVADEGPGVVAAMQPDVLVVDDPITRTAARWIAAGRRAGSLVISVHDLGIGCLDAHLVVDGSVTRNGRASIGATLAGPQYAILDPSFADAPARVPGEQRVLVSLGGGPRARRAAAIAEAIARTVPQARIRVVGGFVAASRSFAGDVAGRIEWIDAPRGLAGELSKADVAVLGGGVSLYESCALGVPAVGVPVVAAQKPTVTGFVRRGAALGVSGVAAPADAVAAEVARLLTDGPLRRAIARQARRTVDGRGAARVAAAIDLLASARLRTDRSLEDFSCAV